MTTRLVGPNDNRIVTVIIDLDASERRPGIISDRTADQLVRQGWRQYHGPAEVKAGWVVPGTDPALHPRSLMRNTDG